MSSATGLTSYTVLTFYTVTKAFVRFFVREAKPWIELQQIMNIDDWISLFVASVVIMVHSTAGKRLPLNVLQVLLPYHPSVQVTFDLIVSDSANGCITWRSIRYTV
uniref:NUP210 Ig-like domain-containing protein n=1 Tax=Wuchereria bancrofti TaxID=6293 RepID=A0A1I8EZP6_WUCBA